MSASYGLYCGAPARPTFTNWRGETWEGEAYPFRDEDGRPVIPVYQLDTKRRREAAP